jgi:hypothetical protein
MPKPKPAKTPVVRRGQVKPYVKATNAVIEQRVEEVAFLLARGASKTQMHETIGVKHNLHWRTVDVYIVRARKLLRDRSNRSREDVRGDAVAFYQSVLLSAKTTTVEKIKAQTRLDEIFGIDAPQRTELSGPEGQPMKLETESTGLNMDHIDAMLRRHYTGNGAAKVKNGNGQGHGAPTRKG